LIQQQRSSKGSVSVSATYLRDMDENSSNKSPLPLPFPKHVTIHDELKAADRKARANNADYLLSTIKNAVLAVNDHVKLSTRDALAKKNKAIDTIELATISKTLKNLAEARAVALASPVVAKSEEKATAKTAELALAAIRPR
jgi:hypothetical protein